MKWLSARFDALTHSLYAMICYSVFTMRTRISKKPPSTSVHSSYSHSMHSTDDVAKKKKDSCLGIAVHGIDSWI